MEWTSSHIRIWFFPRGNVPANILHGRPDPRTWGLPQTNFQGYCNIDRHFKDHSIIFDTTFCGDVGTLFLLSMTQFIVSALTLEYYSGLEASGIVMLHAALKRRPVPAM